VCPSQRRAFHPEWYVCANVLRLHCAIDHTYSRRLGALSREYDALVFGVDAHGVALWRSRNSRDSLRAELALQRCSIYPSDQRKTSDRSDSTDA
jgi:hypothetical protein